MKIGIIREGKVPPDSRVPIIPTQCAYILDKYAVDIKVQRSEGRCFTNEEYVAEGINLVDDVSDCDVLMGVKEVPIDHLIPNKTYLFFSHTIKKQAYNRKLLLAIMEKNIRLIDYETLTNDRGARLIAFGRFAGIVGAHNGILTYGKRTGSFDLKRMNACKDYAEAKEHYKQLAFPNFRTVVTGSGRVASGAVEVLDHMNIRRVTPEEFLSERFEEAVYTQLACEDYVEHKSQTTFDKNDFYKNPQDYKSKFGAYTEVSDLLINGIYWDNQAPEFFSKEDMKKPSFRISVIADVTCDIAPVSSIPSTLYASTIVDPLFGYDVNAEKVGTLHQEGVVDMMTIDNLPNEMPRDASEAFGEQFINSVLNELINSENSEVINRATVTVDGQLGPSFQYLQDYVDGKLIE